MKQNNLAKKVGLEGSLSYVSAPVSPEGRDRPKHPRFHEFLRSGRLKQFKNLVVCKVLLNHSCVMLILAEVVHELKLAFFNITFD